MVRPRAGERTTIMKKALFPLILALALALALPAPAEEGGALTVQGSATVELDAEYATLSVGVDTESVNVADAQQENARLMEQVIAALRDAGCAPEDMKTGGFNVYTSYAYAYGDGGAESRTVVYHVSNSLIITVRDISQIGAYIDAAGNAGANQMNSLTFHSSSQSEAYDRALTLACADAKAQAELLADALGVKITGIVSVTVPRDTVVYARAAGAMKTNAAADEGASTAILAGDLSVSATVQVVFGIE